MPSFFQVFRGISRGEGRWDQMHKTFEAFFFFFGLYLILGGKLHICGHDDLFLLFKFAF